MPPAANDPVTATLRPLLDQQLGRLRSRYFWHGIGKAVLWVTALIVLFVVLDRWLRLPTPIRLLHTATTIAVACYGFVRFVRYPLSRRFSDIDLALWLEHTYPDLHQRLVRRGATARHRRTATAQPVAGDDRSAVAGHRRGDP